MTIHRVFAIRDRALAAYMQPFFVPSVGVAVRSFSDEVNRKDSPMNNHPSDYDCYELGTYNDESGKFECLPEPRQVSRGEDVMRPESA